MKAGIEYGSDNNVDADYESVAFWYGRHEPALELLESLDIGSVAAEEAHAYTNTGELAVYSIISSYEGTYDDVQLNDRGRRHAGFSSFRIAIRPDLQALVLRRRSDYSFTNQTALVAVNGRPAGWHMDVRGL